MTIYARSGKNTWGPTPLQTIAAPAGAKEFTGNALFSANGKMLVAAALGHGGPQNVGDPAVYVYHYDAGQKKWVPMQTIQPDPVPSPASGYGVALAISANGKILVVGSPGSGADKVYVYARGANMAYTQVALIEKPADLTGSVGFGNALALSASGKKLIISDIAHDSAKGAVVTYTASKPSTWQRQGTFLQPAGISNGDKFGYALAMDASGKRLAVSAVPTTLPGIAYVYKWQKNAWALVDSVEPTGGRVKFGYSLAMPGNGDYLGASCGDSISSCVWFLKCAAFVWL